MKPATRRGQWWRGVAAALWLASIGAAPAGVAQTTAVLRDAATLGNVRIPLPPGDWHVLASAAYPMSGHAGVAPSAIRSLILGRLDGDRVSAMLAIRTNAAAAPGGFGLAWDCTRHDIQLARIDTPHGSAFAACTVIGHVLHGVAPQTDLAWRDALAGLARAGITAPPTWLMAGFALADDDDMLDVRYLFDPLVLGLPDPPPDAMPPPPAPPGLLGNVQAWLSSWRQKTVPVLDPRWQASAWAASATAADPRRGWVIAHLTAWAEASRAPIRQGFKGRAASALEWPSPWAVAFGYAPAPAAPLVAAAAAPADLTTLWKTLSWRTVGSTLDAVVGYVVTRSVQAVSALMFVGGLVNGIGYYVHERLWGAVVEATGAERIMPNLPVIGIER